MNSLSDTLLQGELKIDIWKRELRITFAGSGALTIKLPRHIRVEELRKHDLLSWAAVAGCQLATKSIDRDLPPDVAEAVAHLARYACEDS